MSGYVRLYRSLFGHPAFRNDAEAMAFAWMIGKASWQGCRVRYKGHSLYLKRGQLAVSQRDMAEEMDRDKGWIERLWRRLKSEAMIEADVKAGIAVITICNYDEFQPLAECRKAANEAGDEADARQTQGSGKAQNNKGKEGKEVKYSLSRAIPDEWRPAPFGIGTQSRKVTDEWPPGEAEAQLEQFKAHHRAKGNKFKDPQDAWSTWVLNTRKFGVGRNDRQAQQLGKTTAAIAATGWLGDNSPM